MTGQWNAAPSTSPPPDPATGWPPQPSPPDPSAGWVPPAGAPPPPPVRRRSRRRWIVVGVVAAVLGLGAFGLWQREQDYQTGHAAYLAGDCQAAVEPLRRAAGDRSSSRPNDTEAKARAELQECEALLAAAGLRTQGKPADAVLAYSSFLTKYPASPLVSHALSQAQQTISAARTETLATREVCDALATLEAQGTIASPAELMPPLLLACGRVYEAAAAFDRALAAYGRFREDYPEHPLRTEADDAYARATIAEAVAGGAGELPAPQAAGSSGVPGDLAKVVIQNDSPTSMEIVFSGPDVRVEQLADCADCTTYLIVGPDACPEIGPTGEYLLAPGEYDVVVKSTGDDSVNPFSGTWTLQRGELYFSCFYIVRNSR